MSVCRKCARRYPDDHHYCPIDGESLVVTDRVGTTLLGQYQLTGVLGQGSSGTVYEAWHQPTARQVAVKMLNPALVADDAMVRRFHREARAAARLVHPNIVTLYTAGVTEDGVPFLVMELCRGESLDRLLERGPLPADRAVAIVRQVVAAVAATHAAGIVHRDLKPANVILAEQRRPGAPDRVKLVDFGVAKIIAGEVGEESSLSRTGTVWGTPHYLAPEQARGEQVDGRADLYSIGAMLFEMVTGQVPFPGAGMAVLLAHVNRPVPSPDARVAGLDSRLSALVMRCLAKQPADRFASAEALAAALDALGESSRSDGSITGVTLRAAPAAALEVEPRRGRRRWALVALVALLGFVASHWIDLGPAPRRSPAREAGTPAAPSPASPPEVAPPGVRVVVIAEGGYALRVLLPERMVVGVEYEMLIDAWDRDGESIVAPELIVTLDDQTGLSRGVAAKPTSERGRFRFRRGFTTPGPHVMRVYPPSGGARIQLFFDVVGLAEAVAGQGA